MDRDAIREAYNDVRDDNSDTNWTVLKYDESGQIGVDSVGADFGEFQSKFTDDERAFGFLRVLTGDEMSKRSKFVLITWSGSEVSPIKRAKVGTDKITVKEVIQNVAVEFQTSELEEIMEAKLREAVTKAGGANYGTGQ